MLCKPNAEVDLISGDQPLRHGCKIPSNNSAVAHCSTLALNGTHGHMAAYSVVLFLLKVDTSHTQHTLELAVSQLQSVLVVSLISGDPAAS